MSDDIVQNALRQVKLHGLERELLIALVADLGHEFVPYCTIHDSQGEYFAVLMDYTPPKVTHAVGPYIRAAEGRFLTIEEARTAAKQWAGKEGLEYRDSEGGRQMSYSDATAL